MNGRERIKAILSKKEFDRPAVSAWMHFPAVDRKPDAFAERVIQFAEENDWDLVKVQVNAFYITEAYGAKIEFFEQPPLKYQKIKKLAETKEYPIRSLDDLRSLKVITVEESPVLQRDVQAVKQVVSHFQESKVVITTLFSSYSWLANMTEGGRETLKRFIEEDREAVHAALRKLNEVNRSVVDAFADAGVDGFFFATGYTSPLVVSEEDFEEFHRAYDEPLLSCINGRTWFNMLHVHGNADLYIEKFARYPVQCINWEAVSVGISRARLTSAAKLRSLTDKVLVGGVDQFHDFYGTKEEVEKCFSERLADFLSQVEDQRIIFGAGCSLPLDVPAGNIRLLRDVID